MPTITISVDAGANTASKVFTITAPNIVRLIAWAKTQGGAIGGTPPTNAEALERWMKWAMEMTKAHLMEDERRKQAIPDFDATTP